MSDRDTILSSNFVSIFCRFALNRRVEQWTYLPKLILFVYIFVTRYLEKHFKILVLKSLDILKVKSGNTKQYTFYIRQLNPYRSKVIRKS